ncbi:lipoyl synthase [Gelria sp. Kuro-4]|uniref:lipoyl synthase n=1 Tax=Gelria sp. Kuro-4 TaxID=2796927 RepID=UPI001BF076AD|nr:lipoyl synthase [Gelria sp. Kuro-4]
MNLPEIKARPPWLTLKAPAPGTLERLQELFQGLSLHTICEGAACPNAGECFAHRTATFLILGDTCTRGCRFCNVPGGSPLPPDPAEPENLAQAVAALGLKHVVITSVTRDDLADGGAGHFAACIAAVHRCCPETSVEVLVPDFKGNRAAIETVLAAGVTVFGHNVETVPSLYRKVRPGADYRRSVAVLTLAKEIAPGVFTKSGFMLGLGETGAEVRQVLSDLKAAGCDIVTIGQYLQPSPRHLPIVRYVPLEEFARWEKEACAAGFAFVAAGPLVRSSYRAAEAVAALAGRAAPVPGKGDGQGAR